MDCNSSNAFRIFLQSRTGEKEGVGGGRESDMRRDKHAQREKRKTFFFFLSSSSGGILTRVGYRCVSVSSERIFFVFF